MSLGLHGIVIVAIAWASLVLVVDAPSSPHPVLVDLSQPFFPAPPLSAPSPPPVPPPPRVERAAPAAPRRGVVEQPAAPAQEASVVEAPMPASNVESSPPATSTVVERTATAAPPPEVRTNVFAEEPVASERENAPAREARVGAFGVADGAPSRSARSAAPLAVHAVLGAFGVADARPRSESRTSIASAGGAVSAGFDESRTIARGAAERRARSAAVLQGAFGEPVRPVVAPSTAKPVEDPTSPVEILSKPHPIYTREARESHIEGEVLLDVIFEVSGRVRVLRILQRLGHGLDEAAVEAAQGISFQPARRAGLAVDYRATLRVVFQLAN